MNARRNNFDLLRLVFAATVLVWHVHELSRSPALGGLGFVASAEFGVRAFFVVSGFLVVMSFDTTASLREYAAKRVRRIYPAYAFVIGACVLAGLALTAAPAREFFAGVPRYLAANLAFLNFLAPTLPGVFADHAWREMNGALWTLKVEVMFYAAVPVVVWACRRFGSAAVLAALYVASLAYFFALGMLAQGSTRPLWDQLQRQLPGQLTYFLAGAALYLHRDQAARRWPLLLAVAAAAFVADLAAAHWMARAVFEPIWIGILVVYAACGLPYLGNFARYGDLSYGVYIFHFPIIQAAVAAGFFARDPWLAFAGCTAATLFAAFVSWHLVEKPFLARRSHYRLAEEGAPAQR